MEKVRNGEELRQRLAQAAGEDVVACGWGTLGMGNVFAGVTASALVLEFVTMGMKTREIKRIPFQELEFIHSAKGDASTPGLMKMNLESRIAESMTGTLVLKALTGDLLFINFRKMPMHDRNDRAPFRITEHISAVAPEKVHLPDLAHYRKKRSFGGCLKNFALIAGISAAVITIALGLGTGEWTMAPAGGLGTGVVLGAVFAPLVPVFRRMITGRN